MIEIQSKGFNDIFLSEVSKFDTSKYAYETFFNCENDRFSKIARQYGIQNGQGALNYMYKTFHSWKHNYVRPNYSSSYNIVASTAATFTPEEKFVEAYTQLAKHINNRFPKKIALTDVNKTFETIITIIQDFNLEKTTHYSKYIFKEVELEIYQQYVEQIFEFYTNTIFENLNKDIPLFKKVYHDINTSFLEATFNTYLYNIEINIKELAKKNFNLKKAFDLNHPISYEDLINNRAFDFSVEKVSEIAKANNITKIDGFLSSCEIDKILSQKKLIENSKQGGTIKYTLKTNSGILRIKLQILSPIEKLIIGLRIIGFIIATLSLCYYFLILRQAFFFLVIGLGASSLLVRPVSMEIKNLFEDIIKPSKNGRQQ